MRIEFKVPSNFGQEEHIGKVRVEQAGVLVWNELPSQSLEFEPLEIVQGNQAEPTVEDIDLGPFWNAELKLRAFAVAVRGLEPNTFYTFRVDVANEVGWSRGKSEPFSCHTVCRPDAPKLREGPHQVPSERTIYCLNSKGVPFACSTQACRAAGFPWCESTFLCLQRHRERERERERETEPD